MTVLLLGGTAEARVLAERLVAAGVPAVTSLAGAVSPGPPPSGSVRTGGFGGVAGLVRYLGEHRTTHLIDATHPFAAQISWHAASACRRLGVPLLRLVRPSWRSRPDASTWRWVTDFTAAGLAADELGDRVFLSVGRQSAAHFTAWRDRYVLLRVIEPPEPPVPQSWEVLTGRGPFAVAAERNLLLDRGIDVLVTKDAGGSHTAAKLDAAADLEIPVVCVARPPDPPGVPAVASVDAAVAWVQGVGDSGR